MHAPPPILDKLTLGGQVVDIQDLLTSPYEDIREASERVPAVLAFLGNQRAWAVERLMNAERAWRKAEAEAYFRLKNGDFVAAGYGAKVTEDALKHAVTLDVMVEAKAVEYTKRKRLLDSFSETISALKLKVDLVRSSETTRRAAEEVGSP
jgi:hypothetical protein